MVEIEVRLLRGSVYFAGEPIRCQITFTNTTNITTSRPGSTSNSAETRLNHVLTNSTRKKVMGIETIAWASAQIHCQCTINDSRIQLPEARRKSLQETVKYKEDRATSFMPSKGEQGRCLLSTKPTILFCDLTLAAGESKSYYYEDTLPFDSPPSYRGLAVKYCYKITVGAGRLQAVTTHLRLPIRVLVLEGLKELCHCTTSNECSENPFLNESVERRSLLDVALEKLTHITYRRNECVYNVVNKDGHVGCFILFKFAYRIGDEIIGVFDFRDCKVQCTKLVITLQSEEHVCDEYQNDSAKHLHSHTSHSTQQEFCLYTKKMQIQLPIPITATPEFTSDIVDVRWRLHFEFYLSTSPIHPEPCSNDVNMEGREGELGSVWEGPSIVDIEPMTWDLPVKIVPCNPMHASSISLLKTTSKTLLK